MPLVSVQDNEFSTLDVADFDDGLGFGNGGGRDGGQSVSTMKRGARGRGGGGGGGSGAGPHLAQQQQAQHAQGGQQGQQGQWGEYGDAAPAQQRPSFAGPQQMLDAADAVEEMSVMTLDTALQDMDMSGGGIGIRDAIMGGGGSGRSSFASVGLGGPGGRGLYPPQDHGHVGGGGEFSQQGSQQGWSSGSRYGAPPVPPVNEGEQVLNWGDASDSRGGQQRSSPRTSGHHSHQSSLTDDNEQSEDGGAGAFESVAQSRGGAGGNSSSAGGSGSCDPPGALTRGTSKGRAKGGADSSQPPSAQSSVSAGGNGGGRDAAEYVSSLEMKAAHLNFKLAQARSQIDTLQLQNRKLTEERDEYKSKYERGLEEVEDLGRRLDEALRKNETDMMKERMAAARGQRRASTGAVVPGGRSSMGSNGPEDPSDGGQLSHSAPSRQEGAGPAASATAKKAHHFSRRPSVDPNGDLNESYEEERREGRDHHDTAAARAEADGTKSGKTDATEATSDDDEGSAHGFPPSPTPAEGEHESPRTPGGLLGGVFHGALGHVGGKSKKSLGTSTNYSDDVSVVSTATRRQHNRTTTKESDSSRGDGKGGEKKGGGWFSGNKKPDPRDEVWDDDPFSTVVPRDKKEEPPPKSESGGGSGGGGQGGGGGGGGGGWLGKAFGRGRGGTGPLGRRGSVDTSSTDEDGQREGDNPVQN